MRPVKMIGIHCSASAFGDRALIDKWHKDRGWAGVGYHRIVLNGYRKAGQFDPTDLGRVEVGRVEGILPAAHHPFNRDSLALCLIGGEDPAEYTQDQLRCAAVEVAAMCTDHQIPTTKVLRDGQPHGIWGHNELIALAIEQGKLPESSVKACPVIDMVKFRHLVQHMFTAQASLPGDVQ